MPSDKRKYHLVQIYGWYSYGRECGWQWLKELRILAESVWEAKCLAAAQLGWVLVDLQAKGSAHLVRAGGRTYLCFAKNGTLAKEQVAQVSPSVKVAWSTKTVTAKLDPDQSHPPAPAPSPAVSVPGGDAVWECSYCGFRDDHRHPDNDQSPCYNCGRKPSTEDQQLSEAIRQASRE